jgi:hypothetical protein
MAKNKLSKGEYMNEPKTIGPYVYDVVAFTSKLNQNSDTPVEPSSRTGIMQRVENRLIIKRPVNGSRPEGFEYEGEGEVLKIWRDPLLGIESVIEVVKVKGWSSTIDDEKIMHVIKTQLVKS